MISSAVKLSFFIGIKFSQIIDRFLKATEGWKDLDFKRSFFKKCLILSRTGSDLSRQLTRTNIKNPCISELPQTSVSERG